MTSSIGASGMKPMDLNSDQTKNDFKHNQIFRRGPSGAHFQPYWCAILCCNRLECSLFCCLCVNAMCSCGDIYAKYHRQTN